MGDDLSRTKLSLYVYAFVIKDLETAAEPRREKAKRERRSGKPPGPSSVASDLFEAAWPLFADCGCDAEKVAQLVKSLGLSRKKGNQGR